MISQENTADLFCCLRGLTMVGLPAGSHCWRSNANVLPGAQMLELTKNLYSLVFNRITQCKPMAKEFRVCWMTIFLYHIIFFYHLPLYVKLVLPPYLHHCGFCLLLEPLYAMRLNLTGVALCYGNISHTHTRERESMTLFIFSLQLFLFSWCVAVFWGHEM